MNNEEHDNLDETWCLYDGELVDDELFGEWAGFAANVRVVVLSDSCHSGTVTKVALGIAQLADAIVGYDPAAAPRFMPPQVALRAYRAKKELYDSIQKVTRKTEDDVEANVLF